MAYGDDKNKFSKKEERQLKKTSKCKGFECKAPEKREPKNIRPSKETPKGEGEPVKREAKKVRYERTYQKGKPVIPEKDRDEEIVVHKEEKYALYEKKKGAATEKDVKDIEELNKARKIETTTIKKEPEKPAQYEGKTKKGVSTGFTTSAKQFLEKEQTGKEKAAYTKTSEGFKQDSKKQEEYKFRSTREDKDTRTRADYNKEGGGTVTQIDKAKRAKYLKELSPERKKKLYSASLEKREKKMEKAGVIKKEKF